MPTTQNKRQSFNANKQILDALIAFGKAVAPLAPVNLSAQGAELAQKKQLMSALGTIAQVSPAGVGGEVPGSVKKPTQQSPVESKMTGKRPVGDAQSAPMSPSQMISDEIMKTVKSKVRKRAEAMIDKGVSPEQLLSQAIDYSGKSMKYPQASQSSQPPQSQQPAQSPQQTSRLTSGMQKIGGILNDVLSLGGFIHPTSGMQANMASARLADEQAKTYKHQREVGMTASDVQQQGFEYNKEIAKEMMTSLKEGSLSAEYIAGKFDKADEEFREIQSSYLNIKSSLSDPNAVTDMATIFSLLKLLDPKSTARESEQGMVIASASLPSRLINYANRIGSGELLNAKQREDMANLIEDVYNNKKTQFEEFTKEIRSQAERNYKNPDLVTRPMSKITPASGQAGNQQRFSMQDVAFMSNIHSKFPEVD